MSLVEVLQFSVGGDFWRFLGCWLIIGTFAAAFTGAVQTVVTTVRR